MNFTHLFPSKSISGDIISQIREKNVESVKAMMEYHGDRCEKALCEYRTKTHEIMKKQDKIVTDKDGYPTRVEKTWKLPVPNQRYINEIATVFLYGQPPKWSKLSEGSDAAYSQFLKHLKDSRFNSKLRECKRIAGAETQSAMFFRHYREGGKAKFQIRVLAHSKGDEIYIRRDHFENITEMAWGYRTSEQNGDTAYHFDLFTKDKCFRCTNVSDGWQVIEEENKIGKIPFILFEQEKEWEGVESLLHREEYIASKTADNNDYFSDPIAVVSADVVKSMPDKGMAGRLMITDSAEGVDKALKYVTWDSAPQSKMAELEWLQKQILTKTFTPQIDFETMKGLSNVSGKALKQMMLLADIKASKRKETHDELLSRSASLILAIMSNVTDITLSPEIAKLEVQHEFQEPFGEDIASAIGNIVATIDAGILSKEAGIELNPLVKDPISEKERIRKEMEEDGGFENIFGNQEIQERKQLSFVS